MCGCRPAQKSSGSLPNFGGVDRLAGVFSSACQTKYCLTTARAADGDSGDGTLAVSCHTLQNLGADSATAGFPHTTDKSSRNPTFI